MLRGEDWHVDDISLVSLESFFQHLYSTAASRGQRKMAPLCCEE